MTIHMIRSIDESDSYFYYRLMTGVYVFADREGYLGLIADMERAKTAADPIHVDAIPPDSAGMRCAIMPATTYPTRKAVLGILERIVSWQGKPAMQVILHGNRRGFSKLISVAKSATQTKGGAWDHWHIDENASGMEWIVRKSITLNLRGVVRGWSKEDLDHYSDGLDLYAEVVRTGGNYQLPQSITQCSFWEGEGDEERSYNYFPPDMGEYLRELVVRELAAR